MWFAFAAQWLHVVRCSRLALVCAVDALLEPFARKVTYFGCCLPSPQREKQFLELFRVTGDSVTVHTLRTCLMGMIEKRRVMVETLAQMRSTNPLKAIFGSSVPRLFMFYAIISRTNCTLLHKFVVYCLMKSHICNRPHQDHKDCFDFALFGEFVLRCGLKQCDL